MPLFPPTAASFRARGEYEGRLEVVGQHEVAHFLELLLAPLDDFFHGCFLIGAEFQLRLGLWSLGRLLSKLFQHQRRRHSGCSSAFCEFSSVNLGHKKSPMREMTYAAEDSATRRGLPACAFRRGGRQ